MKSVLEQLSSMTIVVADTGDIDAIKKFKPRDATTNPSLILAAAKNPNYLKLIDKALENSKKLFPGEYDQKDAEGFIKINSVRLKQTYKE